MAGSYITQGNGPALVASSVASLAVSWAFSLVRIYVRLIMLKIWKVEDWLFAASQAFFTVLAMCGLMAAIHGNGQHLIDIKPVDIPIAMQYWFLAEAFYLATVICIRLSLGFFLLRICTHKIFILVIKVTMAIISAMTVAYFFFLMFQCAPVEHFWLQFTFPKGGTCIAPLTIQNVTIIYCVFAAITDLIFGILPIFMIWNLKMNRKAKIIVGMLLGVGIIAGCTVIVRIEYVRRVSLTMEFLFATSNVSIWSMIEPSIGICCMAASTYRPLFKSLAEKATTFGGSNKLSSYTPASGSAIGFSKRPGSKLGFSRSGRNAGYLKSADENSSDDDVLVLQKMPTVAEAEAEAEAARRGKKNGAADKGIVFTRTVEVTRQRKGDDMV